ncbi:MAG: cyclic nucleotide-binding domain-containing protein [Acidimicrobiales bacterium]
MASVDFVSPEAFPVFRDLDPDQLASLASRATVVVVPVGQALFRQGQPGQSLFLLAAGRVEVRATEDGGPEHRLVTLGPGGILGEVALLTDAQRTATAVALDDARLWEISRDAFRDAIENTQQWAVVLLLAIAQKMAERLGTVDGRLLTEIARERETQEASGGTRVAELEQLRRRLLADWTF